MTVSLRQRLVAFSALIAALLLLMGWAATTAWRDLGALRQRFTTAQFESFRIAEQLQSNVLALNAGLLAYDLGSDAREWERFQRESGELNAWIDGQRDALKTAAEKRVLADIDTEYDRYLAVAETIRREHDEHALPATARVRQLDDAASRMFALATRLADAHRRALGDFLGESQRSLHRLEALLCAGLVGMLAVSVWVARVFFNETITPLRRQVIETQALAERYEKMASLGVLAAGVAHEIRNPLTAIKTRVFTLKRRLGADTPAAGDAAVIESEILRLERVVRDFLLFARPGDPVLSLLAPRELFRRVRELLGPEVAEREIELIDDDDTAEVEFSGDPQQLVQVLINLVRNAAESIEQRGRITLRARRDHRLLSGRDQEVVVIEVQDTGGGISAAVQERLFDPFFTTKGAGTGLGLSIALRILERHGGTLEFQTEPGRGSTFAQILPIRLVQQSGVKTAAPADSGLIAAEMETSR